MAFELAKRLESEPERKRARPRGKQKAMKRALGDEILVARASRGDEIAFSELVNRHYRRALGVAFGLLKDRHDAEDVVQDAFSRVYRRLDKFAGDSAFYTWLYRIVVNISIDHMRKRKRQRHVVVEDEAVREAMGTGAQLWPGRDTGNPMRRVEERELGQRLSRAMNSLPEIHQAVILLREVEGMSYEEIAQTLQVKKGTVMSRLFHARRALQEWLTADEANETVTDASEGNVGA